MRFLEEQQAWLLPPPAGASCEVLVAGNSGAPKRLCMDTLAHALDALQVLQQQAWKYLNEFVSPSALGMPEQWNLEALECGCGPARRDDQIALVYSHADDINGEWSVTLQLSNRHFFPVAFARRQI
jgi:hypothetical protein